MTDRLIDLAPVRADGWFERIGDGTSGFQQLCAALGDKVVAFSIIAGLRITGVTIDRRHPDASVVSFSLGEQTTEHELPLGELRHRLSASLSVPEEPTPDLPTEPSEDDAQRYLGFRTLLLAPIFEIRLDAIRIGAAGAAIVFTVDGEERAASLQDFRELLCDRVRAESRPDDRGGFSIDLELVPQAEEANARGEFQRTIELLGGWPTPLSVLLRTAEGHSLTPEAKGTLARALGLLGTAHAELANGDWAEEILRLGIQWGQETSDEVTAELFRRLGEAQMMRGRPGPAVGLFQRALGLGAPRAEVLPLLARAFYAAGHPLPAALCADEALGAGANDVELRALLERSAERLGTPWDGYRAWRDEGRA